MSDSSIPLKTCPKCSGEYPATTEFFAANKQRADGLNGWRKTCLKAWRETNREHVLEQKRAYHEEHEEDEGYLQKRAASNRRYREEHHEHVVDYNRQYRAVHRAERRDYNRAFRAENPNCHLHYKRRWRARHPDKVHEYNFRRRALRLLRDGNPHSFTDEDWIEALIYFDYGCAVCGRMAETGVKIVRDHWIPLNSGLCPGAVPTNIVPMGHGRYGCKNSRKDRMPEEWLFEMLDDMEARAILARINSYFEWVRGGRVY